jgi:hypothetical protein
MSNSSTLSWVQQVKTADPNWEKDRLRPVTYQFSNGRTFTDKPNPYSN